MRRRICGLLLVPAALCLLAGVLGVGISLLFVISPNNENAEFVISPNNENAEAGRIGLVASVVLLAVGGVSLASAVAATLPADRPQVWRSFFWWGVVAAIMVIPTGLLFGPTGGFHHHIGFGPLPFFYMVWNGEDPAPGSLQIVTGYEVWFDPVRFGVLLAIWLAVFAGAVGLVRPTQSREALRAGSRSDAAPGAAAARPRE
jgi:hypothetical protein